MSVLSSAKTEIYAIRENLIDALIAKLKEIDPDGIILETDHPDFLDEYVMIIHRHFNKIL